MTTQLLDGSPKEVSYWKKCNTCKKPIQFSQKYWVCSVSTCNRVRTGLVFCDVRCFDAHVPVMNHRDAGAFERRAPSEKEAREQQEQESQRAAAQGVTTKVQDTKSAPPGPSGSIPDEILVVVSKAKAYVRAKSGFNTSDAVMPILSDKLRRLLDSAIQSAESHGRKTILDRDFE